MEVINRSAVIVMHAEPFLKWLHRADSTSAELTLADLRREPTIYLLPHMTPKRKHSVIWRRCARKSSKSNSTGGTVTVLLAHQPRFLMFQRWFEYRFHSMLVDLCEDPLERDEL